MKKKKVSKRKADSFKLLLSALIGAAFVLTLYLARAVDKLIEIRVAGARAVQQTVLPSQTFTGASCGT